MLWLIIGLTSIITWFLTYILHYNRIRLIWCSAVLPTLVIFKWLAGIAYIASPLCEPKQICDGGGILAHSANNFVLFVIVTLVSSTTVFVYWLARK